MEKLNSMPSSFKEITKIDHHMFDFILHSMSSMLGNSILVKCITIEENSSDGNDQHEFTKCSSKILNELIYKRNLQKNLFVEFLNKSIQTYHSHHICSTKTAILFSILLWKRLEVSLNGNSLCGKMMSKYLSIILENLIDLIKSTKLFHLPLANTRANNSKMFSRYLIEERKDASTLYNLKENYVFYKKLIYGICRNQSNISELLFNLLLLLDSKNAQLDFKNILILCQPTQGINHFMRENIGEAEFSYQISEGLAIKLDSNNYEKFKSSQQKETNLACACLIVEASLTHDYVHLGYNKNLNYQEIDLSFSKKNNENDYKEIWQNKLKQILIEFKIKIIFVRNGIDKGLEDFFRINSILVFNQLSSNFLRNLKSMFKCSSMVYVEDFEQKMLFHANAALDGSKNQEKHLKHNYLTITQAIDDSEPIFSIIIETRLQSTSNMHKENLIHSLKRFSNILSSGIYLEGAGKIEKSIAYELINKIEINKLVKPDDRLYFELVKEILSNSFNDLYAILYNNQLVKCDKNDSDVYDDTQSKFECWRLAVYLNKILINSNCSILN